MAGALGGTVFVGGDLADLLSGGATLEDTVPAWFMFAAAYGVGFAMRGQRIQSTLLANRAERLEREREQKARLAVAEERVRIGRELHDIVAHAISVIVVPALAPRPSLAHLDTLAELVREAGLPVELHVEGEAKPLAPGVDLSAYRIVQEALTNALKHAGPASVQVRYGPEEVELEISDDGRGSGDGHDGGHGLVGMRERAALVGGVVESRTVGGRGYIVRALPA